MKSFAKTIKLFFKMPQILIAHITLLVLTNAYMGNLLYAFGRDYAENGEGRFDVLYSLADAQVLCIVFFLFWAFIAYEYLRKAKEADIVECFDSMGRRGNMFYAQQLGVLLLALMAFAGIMGGYFLVGYLVLDFPPVLAEQIGKFILIDVFCLSVAAVFCGSLLSRIRNRFAGYGALLVLGVCMTWDLMEPIAAGLPAAGAVLLYLYRALCFMPPDITASLDPLYGLPFDGYRIAIMGLWVLAGSLWILRKVVRTTRRGAVVISGLVLVFAALMGTAAWDRGSVLLQGDSPWSAIYEHIEAKELPQISSNPDVPDWSVSEYRMEVKLRKELAAVCTVRLAGEAPDQYVFTLYHRFRVREVRDERDEKLKFEQDGDTVTVRAGAAEGKGALGEREAQSTPKTLTFRYEGASSLYYANRHACFLPGIVAWYPQAGYPSGGLRFDIGVDVPGQIFSNLEREGNRFRGIASNATLIKGYIDSDYYERTGNVCYLMEGGSYSLAERCANGELWEELNQLLRYLGARDRISPEKKKVICIPTSLAFSSCLDQYYELDSYVLVGQGVTAYDVLRYHMGSAGESELGRLFFSLRLEEGEDVENWPLYRELSGGDDMTKADELHDAVLEKAREYGAQKVAGAIYARLNSGEYKGDLEGDLAFVKGIS